MRPLFIVGQMRPDFLRHHQNKRPIIHVQPITAPNKFVVTVRVRTGYRVHYQDRFDRSGSYITVTGVASLFDLMLL